VNPIARIVTQNKSICSGTSFLVNPDVVPLNTTYTWALPLQLTAGAIAGGVAQVTPASSISQLLTNNTSLDATLTYTVTPSSTTAGLACAGAPFIVNVTVTPFPELTSSLAPPAICSNTIFSYTPLSNTTVINYNWTRAIVVGISNGASAGTGNPNETLINTSTDPISVVYVYTFTTSGGCTNSQSVRVLVNPTPVFSSSTAVNTRCSGVVFNYVPNSLTTGFTTRWSRSIIPGIANAAESGTGDPNEKLINTTLANISVDYNYSITANACSSEQIITVIVKPVPVVLAKSTTICSGANFMIDPNLVPIATKYIWAEPVSYPLNILTGVTGAGASGALEATISRTLGNSSPTLFGTATYTVTPSSDNCLGNSFELVVKVNPIPVISNTMLTAICSGSPFSFVPTGIPTNTIFSWGNPVVTPTAGLSGGTPLVDQSTISQVLTMTNLVVNTAVYTVSPSAEGCSGANFLLTVPVNPTPVVSNKELSICSEVPFIVTPESVPTGTTYTWVSPTQTPLGTISGSASQSSGQNNFSQTLVNTTNLPSQAVYVVVPKTANCTGLSFNINVIVNPGTRLSSSLNPPAICSNELFSYNPTSTTLGTVFTWTRAAKAGINNASGSGFGNPSEKLLNTTAAPIQVVYTYTLTTGAACAKTEEVKVWVNPTPILTSTTTIAAQCSGLVFNYSPTSSTANAVFSWVRDIVPGISNAKGMGLGDPNEILANVSSGKIFVGYSYTISANGCSSTQELSVAIKPLPTIAPQTNTSCSNETFVINPPNAPLGTTYTWAAPSSNPVLVIEGGTLGASQVAITQTLSNASLYPAIALYTITPIAELCQGNDFTLTATVNPIPAVRDTTLNPICSASPFVFAPTNVPTGILYSWGNPTANPSAGLQGISAQQGQAQISQTLTITNNLANSVEYLVSPVAFGCTGNSFKVTVPVNPTPVVANQSRTICSGESFSVIPSPVPFGTQYTWTTPVMTPFGSLSGAVMQSFPQLSISQVLSNTTNLAAQAYYTVVPKVGSCIGNPFNVTVVVNPATKLSVSVNPPAICSGDIFSYMPASNTAGTSFQWTRSVVVGISNSSAIGLNNPNEKLINITSAPIEVTYVYNLVTNTACTETQIVKVIVNPIPSLTSLHDRPAICSGEQFSYFPTADITGTVFTWTRVVQASISNIAATGTYNPLERIVNTSNNMVVVEYNYTLTVNGCSSTQSVTVPVKPAPSITNQSIIACSNSPFTLPTIATPTGTEYIWSTPVYIPNGSLTGGVAETFYQPIFSQTLTSQTLVSAIANYTITPRAGTCEGVPFKLAVTLRPLPVVANQTLTNICSGSPFNFVPQIAPTGTTYTWSNPIASPSNSLTGGSAQSVGQANISQTLSSTNNILNTATYIVTPSTASCAGNTFTLNVSINPTPIISDMKDSTCSGTPITINPMPVPIGTKYSWNPPTVQPFGAVMGTSAQVSPSATISLNLLNTTNASAKVFYSITPVAGTCIGAPFTLAVGVGVQMPVFGDQAAEICSGNVFNATPVNAPRGTTYTWGLPVVTPSNSIFGISNVVQGVDSIKQVLTNLTLANGVAVYKVTANNSGCVSNQFNANVTVLPLPRTIISGNNNICKYPADTISLNFSGQSPWSFTYREDNKAPITISGITQAPYSLRLPNAIASTMRRFSFTNITNAGCSNKADTSYFTQIIKPSPTGVIYSLHGNYLCNNVIDTMHIVSSDSPTFKWMLNGTLMAGETKDTLLTSLPGRYSAILTNSVGCSDTLTSTYTLNKIVKPLLKLSYNTYCVNTPMSITNLTDTSTIGITNWLWDFGDGNIQSSFNSVNTYSTGGNYHITLKATQLNCAAASVLLDTTVDIQVPIPGMTMPSVSAYKSVSSPIGVRSIPSYKYRWTPSWGISNRDSANVNFSFATTQQYVVNLISPAGCVTHDSLLVRVFDNKLVDILVPKSFTPNSDGVNDRLFPYLTGIKDFHYFKIFNRQNQLMFETKNFDEGWDGNLRSTAMPMGIYIWVATGVATDGTVVEKKGQTLLLR
jgi:gliding motility-associated-like protein